MSVCLSARPSHAGIVCKRLYISSKFFSPSGSPTILVIPHQTGWQYSDRDHLNESAECKGVWKKSRFMTNIGLYLGTDADRAIVTMEVVGNRTQAFERYHFECLHFGACRCIGCSLHYWTVAEIFDMEVFNINIIQHQITQKRYKIELCL